MTGRSFVDTNVWVYAVDGDEPAKQARAREVIAPSAADDIVISTQVLGEFYVTVTRKLARPVTPHAAGEMVAHMRKLAVTPIDGDHVAGAISGSQSWGISYWDALIVTAAAASGCTRLLTEDLADGTTYGDVRIENPFAPRVRASEARSAFEASPALWDDVTLTAELARYEQACVDAGMRRNAVHSYWDYARRFLEWRTGAYRPRGVIGDDRPVPSGQVTTDALEAQAHAYARVIEAAGRERATIDTYHRHAMFFVRWLRGEFRPGARLR
jgi:predicted nucleic acid-binding protein